MQDNMKHNNVYIIQIPEDEVEQGVKHLFEKVMMEKFPNLMRVKGTPVQEALRTPNKRNPKRHIIIKMVKFKDKDRILKAAREKQEVTYKEALIRLTVDF